MTQTGQVERATQNRVAKVFKSLGNRHLGDWKERGGKNVEEDILRAFLKKQGHPDDVIERALYQLAQAAQTQTQSLYDANEAVYNLLRYGVQLKTAAGELWQTVPLVDWKYQANNDFAIAEEVTVKGKHGKRPDIVLYLNGIAVGLLELKRSTVSVAEGIRQNLDNQKKEFIQPFFSTMQLVLAGNDTEGLRYGTIETPEKHYLKWKEETDGDYANLLDHQLSLLCNKLRLLDILQNFVAFDAGVKKLCRPNQYFGVKAARQYVLEEKGGIIWHTQGSGKSLTMVWLAKWIRENVPGSRVLIITDRTELDEQIERVFLGVREQITRTGSGAELLKLLSSPNPWLICSLIHKFGTQDEGDIAAFVQEVQGHVNAGFQPHGKFFVFVDEAHRTQSGALHRAMKALLPGATLIGFTGTPLLKKDRQTSLEVFGPYIHQYRYDEAVRDRVVLDLKYEARDIDQNLTSPTKIDKWFEAKTKGLTPYAKTRLKQKWGTMQKVLSSEDRLSKIVADIMLDMEEKPRLESGRGNAMLVSGSIYQACKLYEMFQDAGFDKCAIVTSYKPNISDIKGEETGEGLTEKLRQYDIYQKMLNGQSPEDFEKKAKEDFIKRPGQMKLLIVVDKLLTGFDAPSATYLYIDKSMRDHALFQAICRVNRLHGEDKEYGYVIDYKDLFGHLGKAMSDYTGEAFSDFDPDDIKDMLEGRLSAGRDRLEENLEKLRALCEPVPAPRDQEAHLRYFCGLSDNAQELSDTEPRRMALYKHTSAALRAYADIAGEMAEAGYSEAEAEKRKADVTYFQQLVDEVKLRSGDYIDLKLYEPAMRHLIDTYIRAEESEVLSQFDDMTLIDLLVNKGPEGLKDVPGGQRPENMAETIENNLRRVITNENPVNPKYYEQMSVLLDLLIQERRDQAADYRAHLAKLAELARKVKQPHSGQSYPASLDTGAKRALYDNLGKSEQLALAVDAAIQATRKDGWRGNKIKERELRNAVKAVLDDDEQLAGVMELIRNQAEY